MGYAIFSHPDMLRFMRFGGYTASFAHAIYCPLHEIVYIGPSPECNVVSEAPNHPNVIPIQATVYLSRLG